MSEFHAFKKAVDEQFKKMSKLDLFTTGVSKDEIWDVYLGSFPEGSNPLYKERTTHDCQCCKQFLRSGGNVVAIVDGMLRSIWDVNVGGDYQVVADALSELVKSRQITNQFFNFERNLGTDYNNQLTEGGKVLKWEHFHFKLPRKFVQHDSGPILSRSLANKEVFKRSLDEISVDAIETVIEFIEQNSIYRGAEHKSIVELLQKHLLIYNNLPADVHKDHYAWEHSMKIGNAAGIRNTVIGTLLTDISDGVDLDRAVASFESKVAPMNYKRPTALITKSMIANAQKKVEELGIANSLPRRYAVTDDLTINNVLFADRSVKKAMNVFDEISSELADKVPNLDKIDEIDVETFISTILPKAESVEIMLENRLENNLMSLIAPINPDAPQIFKWGNNFSWAYNGEVTDSVKERVKSAGGNVTGDLRCSLSWFNHDDLDVHAVEPDGTHISYNNKHSYSTKGQLDVDMNANGPKSRNAVENITWPSKCNMTEGRYKIYVHNYTLRERIDIGFDFEIEFDGVMYEFHYDKLVKQDEKVVVAEFDYSHANGFKIVKSLPTSKSSKEVYGINTEKFHKVDMILNSPNHWDGEETGNKHLFFILDGCKNDKASRGFFNEFLKGELNEHRKVFEVLGSKLKTDVSDNQLSGLGFSSTKTNYVLCKVTGSFARTIKITF